MLIGNGTLLTNAPDRPLVANGAVAVTSGRIAEVGDWNELRKKYPDCETVDAEGGLILPGLVNVHHHFYSALARGMIRAKPVVSTNFLEILENLWWRLDQALTLEDVRLSAAVSLADSIRCGVTSIVDHHASFGAIRGSLKEIETAAREFGVRACLCFEVSDRCGEQAAKNSIDENREFLKSVQNRDDGMLAGLFGLHASFTLSDATLAACREAAGGAGFHVHVAEGEDDVRNALSAYGKRVVERLNDFAILGPKSLAVHCIHVSASEMELLADSGTTVVHNPQSNMSNAVGASPLMELLRRGIRVGLGTDGYTHDILESAKAACLLQRHHLSDPGVAWVEPYAMLLNENPRIAGDLFGRRLGVLEAGAAADIVVAEYDPPTPLLPENIAGHLHFGLYGQSIHTSVINGKLVMRQRKLLCVDEAALRAKSRELAEKLWRNM